MIIDQEDVIVLLSVGFSMPFFNLWFKEFGWKNCEILYSKKLLIRYPLNLIFRREYSYVDIFIINTCVRILWKSDNEGISKYKKHQVYLKDAKNI